MKLLTLIILIFANVNAYSAPRVELTKSDINRAILEVAYSMDERVLIGISNRVEHLMKLQGKQSAHENSLLLTCVLGHVAIISGVRIGACLDAHGNAFDLFGSSRGFSLIAKATILIGFVKGEINLEDSYRGRIFPVAELLMAENINQTKNIILVGSGAKAGFDYSTIEFRLRNIKN